jgi:hypothetical protein
MIWGVASRAGTRFFCRILVRLLLGVLAVGFSWSLPVAAATNSCAYDVPGPKVTGFGIAPLSRQFTAHPSPQLTDTFALAHDYDAAHLLRVLHFVNATNTPKPGTALEVVPNFADEAKAFEHYAKHSKGVVLRNGKATVKAGGADVPEFATFADYRNAARSFMSGSGGSGTLNGFKDGNLLRFDPSTGYFGVLSNKGVVRTFFRPDDGIAYFYEQFTP